MTYFIKPPIALALALVLAPVASAGAGQPAARQGDPVSSPAGVPGTILSGSGNVFIGGQPAARIGDTTLCVLLGPSGIPLPTTQAITGGSPTVLINGRPAARMGDPAGPCTISGGFPTVLE